MYAERIPTELQLQLLIWTDRKSVSSHIRKKLLREMHESFGTNAGMHIPDNITVKTHENKL